MPAGDQAHQHPSNGLVLADDRAGDLCFDRERSRAKSLGVERLGDALRGARDKRPQAFARRRRQGPLPSAAPRGQEREDECIR